MGRNAVPLNQLSFQETRRCVSSAKVDLLAGPKLSKISLTFGDQQLFYLILNFSLHKQKHDSRQFLSLSRC
jgi:hypothetical protein